MTETAKKMIAKLTIEVWFAGDVLYCKFSVF